MDNKLDVELMAGVVREELEKLRVLLDDVERYFPVNGLNSRTLAAISCDYTRIRALLALLDDVNAKIYAAVALEEKAVG